MMMFAMAAALMLAAVSCKKDDGGLGTDVESLVFDTLGGSRDLEVRAAGEWRTTVDQSWVTLEGAVNVGDGVVTVIAEPWDNADGARTAYITVSTCCESVTVAVRQTDEENFN